ncbi:hypothetical protein BH10PSE19_BH10PSE19_14080 [soil metagenome]
MHQYDGLSMSKIIINLQHLISRSFTNSPLLGLTLAAALLVHPLLGQAQPLAQSFSAGNPTSKPVQHSLWRSAATNTSHKLLGYVKLTLNALHHTRYRFGGKRFDTAKGIYSVDCSGYVNNLLGLSNPHAFHEILNQQQISRPNTTDYYRFLGHIPYGRSSSHWYHVRGISELRAGDILVYSSPGRSKRRSPGHVMIVVETPKRDSRATGIYHVRVADSAHSGHSYDTRRPHTSGIGVGTLLLKANPHTNQPIAFAWREDSRWKLGVDFAMGRMIG